MGDAAGREPAGARKTDRRIERTRSSVMAAMRELVLEKDYDDITVTEIARRAGVDRKTFYLHYPSKDALLRALERQQADTLLAALHEATHPGEAASVEHVCEALDRLLADDLPLFRRVASNPSYRFLMMEVREAVRDAIAASMRTLFEVEDGVAGLAAEFYASGVVATYIAWLRADDGEGVDRGTLTQLLVTTVCASIDGLPFARRPGAPTAISAYAAAAAEDLARRFGAAGREADARG